MSNAPGQPLTRHQRRKIIRLWFVEGYGMRSIADKTSVGFPAIWKILQQSKKARSRGAQQS